MTKTLRGNSPASAWIVTSGTVEASIEETSALLLFDFFFVLKPKFYIFSRKCLILFFQSTINYSNKRQCDMEEEMELTPVTGNFSHTLNSTLTKCPFPLIQSVLSWTPYCSFTIFHMISQYCETFKDYKHFARGQQDLCFLKVSTSRSWYSSDERLLQ